MTRSSTAAPARRSGAGGLTAGAALLLLVAACGGPDAGERAVPDSVYVEAMARLVLLDTAVPPTLEPALSGASLDSARGRVLRRWGVDDEELLEFARNRGDDPERMQAIWQRVYELSSTLREQDWSPASEGGPGGADSADALPRDSLEGPAPDSAGDG